MLGIGIVTYKRTERMLLTLEAIQHYTSLEHELAVAVDAPTGGDIDWCHENNILCIHGPNAGVVWNKNRLLHYFMRYTDCDPILLLEDDCWPVEYGWDVRWAGAGILWNHVNFVHPKWPKGWAKAGKGIAENPYLTREITGQATVTSRAAMNKVGYLDTKYKGYGFGHVEWTERFGKLGVLSPGLFPAITEGLVMEDEASFKNMDDVRRNMKLINKDRAGAAEFKWPWFDSKERTQLETEVLCGIHYKKDSAL